MPDVLSDSRASGLPLHTRSLSVHLERTAADRFCARGDVIDLRKNGCVPSVDDVQPAGIIHMMKIELTTETPGLVLMNSKAGRMVWAVVVTEPETMPSARFLCTIMVPK